MSKIIMVLFITLLVTSIILADTTDVCKRHGDEVSKITNLLKFYVLECCFIG